VIVGFGGISPAGRSSSHHGYRRMVIDKLDPALAERTYQSLATLMQMDTQGGISEAQKSWILEHTLIRKIEDNLFNPADILQHRSAKLHTTEGPISFKLKKNQMPDTIPPGWQVAETPDGMMAVTIPAEVDVLFPDSRTSRVNSAGQLPTGFDPEKLYQSRSHPRGLQLAVYGASDAINSLGIDWKTVRDLVPADQISVYASSAMGQLDYNGNTGMLAAPFLGKRVTSKNCPLGLAEMVADFVNAYILGNVGTTGANIGACATFLYNLRQGIQDIRSGKYRAVVVGASEAPLTPEVIEGYRTMGALAEDEALRKLDGLNGGEPDYTRACRPFSDNCGFTLAEGAQFIVLFEDQLALELGAHIYGSVADVYVNADGFKKSIPGPGIGNYVTIGKSMGLIRSMLGEESLRQRSYMMAHGTGTPQNRVTESHIIDEMAKTFGVKQWPVAGIKAYVGHSLGTAAGDQLAASLGVWQDGLIPGIRTIDHLADDIYHSHADFLLDHKEIDPNAMDTVFINAKGFGGNNATAAILSPTVTMNMLEKRHGKSAISSHSRRNESVKENIETYDERSIDGENNTIYHFGVGVIEGEELDLNDQHIGIPGHAHKISLNVDNPYEDMT